MDEPATPVARSVNFPHQVAAESFSDPTLGMIATSAIASRVARTAMMADLLLSAGHSARRQRLGSGMALVGTLVGPDRSGNSPLRRD